MDDHGGNHHDGSVGDAASDLMSLFRPPSSLPTTKQDGGESKQPQSGIAQAEPEPSASGVPAPSITPSVNGSYDATKMRYASSSLSSSSVPEAISKIQKPRVGLDREVTSVHSNRTSESTSLLQYSDAEVDRGTDKFVNLKQRNSNKGETTAHPSYSTAYHLDGDVHSEDKSTTTFRIDDCWKTRGVSGVMDRLAGFRRDHLGLSTYLGAAVFLLYHVVFCLAMGSTIRRPHSTTSTLGIMTKTAAMGVMLAGPIYILALYKEIPAIYPTVDLFLAPFMAQIAKTIDHHLYQQGINSTESFMATFGVVSGIGMLTAGVLILLASQFKLANLGSYLPFPVLCGFFTAVGVSMWSLAFTVDTNGQNFGVFWSGDWNLIANSVLHHAPTVLVATVMKWLGAKNPLSVSSLVVVTILLFYLVMLLTQTPLSKAVQLAWFWSAAQLVPPSHPHNVSVLFFFFSCRNKQTYRHHDLSTAGRLGQLVTSSALWISQRYQAWICSLGCRPSWSVGSLYACLFVSSSMHPARDGHEEECSQSKAGPSRSIIQASLFDLETSVPTIRLDGTRGYRSGSRG